MTPYPSLDTELTVEAIKYSDRSYDLKPEKIQGFVEGIEALAQSIAQRLGTQKFNYPIYSFSYGVDWRSLIGQPQEYYRPEAKRMIEETLMEDDRIEEISNFKFEFGFNSCHISFDVTSKFGNYTQEVEVPA